MEKFTWKQNIISRLSTLKKSDVEYYLFFIIMECGEALNKGSSDKIFLTFAAAGILFLAYKLLDSKYGKLELLSVALLGILGILIYYNTNKAGGFLSILALIGLKGVDLTKLLKLSFYIRLAAFAILLCLASFDMIENAMISNLRGDSIIVRYSMGFSHPNQFHLSYIILLLLLMYLYFEKLNGLHLILLGISNILVYTKSFSRTSTLIGFTAIALIIWLKSDYFPKIKNAFCVGILPFCFLISIAPALMYDKIPNIRTIDRLLQWRITFSKHYLDSYSLRLFGNNLNRDPIVLDSGYVELIINYGLIFTFLYIVGFMIIIYRYTKKKMYRELLIIVCLSIYGITESFIPNLFVNISLVFMGEIIFNTGRKYENSLAKNMQAIGRSTE